MDSSSYRSNRHATQSQPAAAEPAPAAPAEKPAERAPTRSVKHKNSERPKLPLKLIGIVAAVLLVAVVGWMFLRSGSVASSIDSGKLQAVFFTNGQVYFGKLKVLNDEYMKLTDIYYLQAKTADSKSPQETSGGSNSSDVQLIKLGDEIHGPEDEMVFSKSQVLFFENLKPDGNVSKTIAGDETN